MFGIFIVVGILVVIVVLDLGILGKEVSCICKKRNWKKSVDLNKSDIVVEFVRFFFLFIRFLINISINILVKKLYVNMNWCDWIFVVVLNY